MEHSIASATVSVFEILSPFTPNERRRIVDASMTLLGHSASADSSSESADQGGQPGQGEKKHNHHRAKSPADTWMKKHGLTEEVLEEFFHIEDDKVTVIALPGNGKSKKSQTIAAYLATGAAAILLTGDGQFSDEAARANCDHLGCFDSPNHAKYLKGFGNLVTGSKSQGWRLTAPGLNAIAKLLLESAAEE